MATQRKKYQEQLACLKYFNVILMTIECLLLKYHPIFFIPSFFWNKIQKIVIKFQLEYKLFFKILKIHRFPINLDLHNRKDKNHLKCLFHPESS